MADEEIAATKFTLECAVDVEFDATDIARNLSPLQVSELIIELDEEVGDWEHTLYLAHYFNEQLNIARDKAPEMASKTMEQLREMMVAQQQQKGASNGEG